MTPIDKCIERFKLAGFEEPFIRRLKSKISWGNLCKYQYEIIKFPNDKYRTVHNIKRWVEWKENINAHYNIGIAFHEGMFIYDRFAPGVLKDMVDKFNNKDIFISLDHSVEIKKEIAAFKHSKYTNDIFGLTRNEMDKVTNSIKQPIKDILMDTIKQTPEEERITKFETLAKRMLQIECDLTKLKNTDSNPKIRIYIFEEFDWDMSDCSNQLIHQCIKILGSRLDQIKAEINDLMYPKIDVSK